MIDTKDFCYRQKQLEFDKVFTLLQQFKPTHFMNDGDNFYSCPLAEGGCGDETQKECNCGFEKELVKFNELVGLIESLRNK